MGQLDARIRDVQSGLNAAEARLEQLAGDLVNAEAQLSAAKAELSAAKTQLHERAVEAYVNPAGVQVVDVILRSGSMRDLSAKVSYLESIVGAQARAVHRFDALRQQAQDLAGRVDATRDQARQQREKAQELRQEAETRTRQAEERERVAQQQVREARDSRKAADEASAHADELDPDGAPTPDEESVRGRSA